MYTKFSPVWKLHRKLKALANYLDKEQELSVRFDQLKRVLEARMWCRYQVKEQLSKKRLEVHRGQADRHKEQQKNSGASHRKKKRNFKFTDLTQR
jgi:hypothetical protein